MSQTKSKEELTRLAWLAALRREGHRKCAGVYFKPTSGRVCALGLLIEVVEPEGNRMLHYADVVGARAGLSAKQTGEVLRRNDGTFGCSRYSFAEIADMVEGWFKP